MCVHWLQGGDSPTPCQWDVEYRGDLFSPRGAAALWSSVWLISGTALRTSVCSVCTLGEEMVLIVHWGAAVTRLCVRSESVRMCRAKGVLHYASGVYVCVSVCVKAIESPSGSLKDDEGGAEGHLKGY